MPLKNPAQFFESNNPEKEEEVLSQDTFNETFNRYKGNLDKVEQLKIKIDSIYEELNEDILNGKIDSISEQLENKISKEDLENAMFSHLMVVDENFKSIKKQVNGVNQRDLQEFKKIYNTYEKLSNLLEDKSLRNDRKLEEYSLALEEYSQQYSYISEDVKIRLDEYKLSYDNLYNLLKEESLKNYNKLNESLEEKSLKDSKKLEEYSNILEEYSSVLKQYSRDYSDVLEEYSQKYSNVLEDINSQLYSYKKSSSLEIQTYIKNHSNDLKELKDDVFSHINFILDGDIRSNIEKVENKINIVKENYENTDFIDDSDLLKLKEEVFSDIKTILDGDIRSNIRRIENKIDIIKERYESIDTNSIVGEVVKEGLLNISPNEKNSDSLTPLNQNFVTFDQLQKHYTLFINRIQQQLSTLGGGGETQLKYLDDLVGIATNASAYDGKYLKYDHSIGKFEFATVTPGGPAGRGGAGIGTWANYDSNTGVTTTKKVKIQNDLEVTGVITAISFKGPVGGSDATFIGDGSGLTGITASGSGVIIKDSGSLVGTAGTINFGDNLDVTPISSGIVTVSSSGGGLWEKTDAGINTVSNVGIGTTNPRFLLEVGAVGASGTSLFVNGDARVTGILSVGEGTITLDPNAKTISGLDELKIGSGSDLITLKRGSSGQIEFIDAGGEESSVGVGTTVSINTIGIITAQAFHGNGANLTQIPTTSLTGTITNLQLAGDISNDKLAGSITQDKLFGGITTSKLAQSTVSYGGVTLNLGEVDLTPAFNLSDATAYPTSALVGTITNSQLAGSISNDKLAGSISNDKLAGSITNAKLVNDSVSYGGVEVELGSVDLTPAFNLTDATNYPYTSLTGVTTDIVGDISPQLGGNLDLNSKNITGTGSWQGTAIADDYIASAATWNAKQNALTFGIANTNAVKIDSQSVSSGYYAQFTQSGIKGIPAGISNNNLVEIDGQGVADDDYARFTSSGLEGRSYTEVKTDLSLGNVENTALSTWTGNTSITSLGVVGVGTWQGTPIAAQYIANTSVTAGSYTNASITVDAQGRLTAASSGSGGGGASGLWASNATGINTSTNIGIGTTTASSALTVVGDSTISGVATFNDDVRVDEYLYFGGTANPTYIYGINGVGNTPGKIIFNAGNNYKLELQSGAFYPISDEMDLGKSDERWENFYAKNVDISGITTFVGLTTVTSDDAFHAKQLSISGVVTATTFIGNLTGTASTSTSAATAYSLTGNIGDFSTRNITSTGVITATSFKGPAGGAAATFIGDGSGLTGVTASGSGIVIKDSGSLVGTAGTIDFGDNLSVSAISGASVTITASGSKWDSNATGINTSTNVGIGTTTALSALTVSGDGNFTGVITATTFNGSGSSLTSIPNSALNNSLISYGGVEVSLGGAIAHPEFNLTNATDYPYTSLTGVTTDIIGDTTPQLGGNLDLNFKNITGTGSIDITGNLDVSGVSTLGTVASGTWQGTDIADDYIASAATWNAKQNALTFGIVQTNAVKIDSQLVAAADYAKFTTDGLEGRSAAEVKTDLSLNNVENTALSTWTGNTSITSLGVVGVGTWQGTDIADDYIASAATWNAKQNALTFGIANINAVKIDSQLVAAADYAKFTTAGLEGRSYSEVKTDLSLGNVENTALSTWTGNTSITSLGVVGVGTWQGTKIAAGYLADTAVTAGSYTNASITVDAQGRLTAASSGSGSGLAAVVDDTTPELGGYLDLNSKGIYGTGIVTATTFSGALTGTATTATNLADASNITTGTINVARLGSNAADAAKFLRGDNTWQTVSSGGITGISTTGTSFFNNVDISGVTTVGTEIRSDTFSIKNALGTTPKMFFGNSGTGHVVRLYADGNEKFTTTSTGIFVQNDIVATGNLKISGVSTLGKAANGAVELYYDNSLKFITVGTGVSISNGTGNTATIFGPSDIIIDPHPIGVGTTSGNVRIKGDLYVDGTQFIVNSETITLGDFVVGIGTTVTTDALTDGAGIGIGSIGYEKTFLYEYNSGTNPSLKSSENLNVASGKAYQIAETSVLNATTLGSGVVNSSLTGIGTITSGTWQGTDIADNYIASAATWNAKQNALTFGIADTNAVKIDDADAVDDDYAKFTATGIEGRSAAELKSDLSLSKSDVGLANVENTALSTWTGTTNITTLGTVASGIWSGTAIADGYLASTFLKNIVDDTSPQLGENLDINGKYITGTGGISITGVVTSTDFNTTSDFNLKTNIQSISNPLEKVMQIRGVDFEWNDTNKISMGVIAQEIEKVFPQLVTDSDPKTVNYNGLIGLLVECVKEQQKEINELKNWVKGIVYDNG